MSGLKWGLISPISGLTWTSSSCFCVLCFFRRETNTKTSKAKNKEDEVHVRPEIGLITPHFRPDMDFILFFLDLLVLLFGFPSKKHKTQKQEDEVHVRPEIGE